MTMEGPLLKLLISFQFANKHGHQWQFLFLSILVGSTGGATQVQATEPLVLLVSALSVLNQITVSD